MERIVQITTPQNVSFDFRLAGIPSRTFAWLIDCLVILSIVVILFLAVMLFFGVFTLTLATTVAAVVMPFLVNFGYAVFFETRWNGQTPGKRMLGLRVIRDDGTALDVQAALLRNLLRIFDGFPQIWLLNTMLLGALCACFSQRAKRLGDWAGETMVVQVPRTRVPKGFQATRGAYNSLREDRSLVARIQAEITLTERELLIDTCVRSDEIDLKHRTQLFEEAAAYLCDLLELEMPEHLSAEKFVQNVTDVLLDESASL